MQVNSSIFDGSIPEEEIAYLQENYHLLSESEKLVLRGALKYRERGCRTNRWMNMVRPNLHPKQKLFLSLEHREVMFGGAAGGSKSDSLLLSMMQYLDVPGYSSIIFRRTFKDLSGPGSIMDRAKSWFNPLKEHGVRWSANDNSFYFPTGRGLEPSRYAFAYLQHDDDKRNYQGWELHACCEVSTPVVMADGSRKRIGSLSVGDVVSTPEGPRKVTKVAAPKTRKCVKISVFDSGGNFVGVQSQSTDHGVLTPCGWTSCGLTESSQSTQIHASCKPSLRQPSTCRTASGSHQTRHEGWLRQIESSQLHLGHLYRSAFVSFSKAHQTDSGVSDDEHREFPLPAMSFGRLMLFEPHPHSVSRELPLRAVEHEKFESLIPDSRCGCRSCCRFCGEQPRSNQESCPGELTLPGDAEERNHPFLPSGGPGTSRKHSRPLREKCIHQELKDTAYSEHEVTVFSSLNEGIERRSICDSPRADRRHPECSCPQVQTRPAGQSDGLPHPYAPRMLAISEKCSIGSFQVSGFCIAEVRDIQIEGSSCYITEMGICNRNCAFDELTQHPRSSYSYLFSRLRRKKGVNIPIRMRSATNPGGKFGEWVKDDFIPQEYLDLADDPDAQFSKMWEKRTDCGECRATGLIEGDECLYCEGMGYRTRLFVPSRIQDNPSIDMAEYRRSLANLPTIERYRLENGDWSISEQGDLFKEPWARYYSRRGDHFILHRPELPDIVAEIGSLIFFMTVDTASKEKTTHDFTCIASWAFHQKTNSLILVHVLMERMEVPKIPTAIINQSAALGSQFVVIESAQCGIGVIQELRGAKGNGMSVMDYNPHTGDKVARSTTATVRMEAGGMYFPSHRPGWLTAPFAQLLGFNEAAHDDFVDCVSMAAWYCHNRHGAKMTNLPVELKRIGT